MRLVKATREALLRPLMVVAGIVDRHDRQHRHSLNIRNEARALDSDSVGVSQVEGGAVAASDDDDDGGDDDGESDRRHSLRSYSRNTPVLPPAVANFDSLPSQARLRTSEVLILMGLSRTTLHRRVIAQAFPPPRKTPTGQNYWTADDVRRALAQS